jgi:hypothetical protein
MPKTPLDDVLREAGAFFMKESPVHKAASRIAKELTKLEIPFAIAGGLAVGVHGHKRVTEDVDVILTAEGLARFKAKWLGRGWVERVKGSRGMRDTIWNVPIDVLVTGDFPGDGKPKPVSFPDPTEASELDREHGYPVLTLDRLVELKLASGMTAPHRLRDLADVIDLTRALQLERGFGDRLNDYVRAKFDELWLAAQHADEDD